MSTNVERPGYTMSEKTVGDTFMHLFKDCNKRIIVASFASNVHRIQQIINAAVANNRKVAFAGRSMENILNLGLELGYIQIPEGHLVDLASVNQYPSRNLHYHNGQPGRAYVGALPHGVFHP
jgi:ribonuclease J